MQHTALCDGLKRGSAQYTVDALLEEVPIAELLPNVHGQLLQLSVVCVRHAGETHAKPDRGRVKRAGLDKCCWISAKTGVDLLQAVRTSHRWVQPVGCYQQILAC